MLEGPFKTAVEAEKLGILKEEYVTYRVTDGYLEKKTVVRLHKPVGEDYHDTMSTERLVKVDETTI